MSEIFDDTMKGWLEALEIEKGKDILPDEDILMVNALIKKLVIAWDPDFTKLTEREKELLEKSDNEMKNGDFVSEEDVWS